MLFWKIFAVVSVAGGAALTFAQLSSLMPDAFTAFVNAALFPFYATGLVAYAFGKRPLPGAWWGTFAFIFGAWLLWVTASGMVRAAPMFAVSASFSAVAGFATAFAWMFFVWLGVWRYARGQAAERP